ncbi:MAG: hypothetical protein RR891_07555 [Clostridium sp.]
MAFKEYVSIRDLRDVLELYDGEMEFKIVVDGCEYDFDKLEISVKGDEPKLLIKTN